MKWYIVPLVLLIQHECSPIERSLVSLFPSLLLKSPAIKMTALGEYRVVIESKSDVEIILRVLVAECYLISWAISVDDRQSRVEG